MSFFTTHKIEFGEYAIEIDTDTHRLTAYRHGQVWEAKTEALIGDNFVAALVLQLLEERGEEL